MNEQTSRSKSASSTKPTAAATRAAASEKNIGMAVIAYLIFFVPLLTDAKDDPFVKFHVKQGLTLFIAYLIAWAVGMIPFIGWFILLPILNVALFILLIVGIIRAAQGEQKPLPIIGKYGESFKF